MRKRDWENARQYAKERYHKRREYALEKLGGKCNNCESTRYLEVHHKDPSTNTGNIFGYYWSRKLETFDEELDKCILLCRACHHKEHKR